MAPQRVQLVSDVQHVNSSMTCLRVLKVLPSSWGRGAVVLPGVPGSGCLVTGVLASTAPALALAGVEVMLRTLLRSDRTAADLQQGGPA